MRSGEPNVSSVTKQKQPSGKDTSETGALFPAPRGGCRWRKRRAEGIKNIISSNFYYKDHCLLYLYRLNPAARVSKSTHVMLKLYKIHRVRHTNRLRTRILILQKTEIISLTTTLSSVLHVISLYIYSVSWMKYTRVSCYYRRQVRANDGTIFIHERQRVRQSSFNKRWKRTEVRKIMMEEK
jgi:hypothetical protein